MPLTRLSFAALAIAGAIASAPRAAAAQESPDLSGRWTLDRASSQLSAEVGFNADWLPSGGSDTGAEGGGGGRGRRGSGSPASGAFPARRESEDDAARARQLTDEARHPSAHLIVADAGRDVTITDARGLARTFHPDGRQELLQLAGVPVGVTAKREGGRLVVLYQVEAGRELRYTYSRSATRPELIVDVQFLEKGKGDSVRRVYVPAGPTETMIEQPPPPAPAGADRGVPAAGQAAPAAPAVDERPDAALKGITTLGVVIEGLSAQAVACGLNQSALEADVSKRLTEAGFKVVRNSDEDTYVYVDVLTASLSTGLCVSRYDVSVTTQTTARLSYHEAPVPVQVSLLNKGGIAGGPSATHAADVVRGVLDYVDQFAARIRNANK